LIKSRFADEDLYFRHQTLDDDDDKANPDPSKSLRDFFPIVDNKASCECPALVL